MLKGNRKVAYYILISLGLLNVLVWISFYYFYYGGLLEVIFFDVGQGDAIFIETPDRVQILIDGGPSSTILEKLNSKMPFWDKTIDLVVLTHPDSDHVSGLIKVLESYKVKHILWTGILKEGALYDKWVNTVEAEKAQVYIAQEGQRININNINLEVLYPFESLEGQIVKDVNASSVILKLNFKDTSFLFTGDTSKFVEGELVNRSDNLKADVLKVAHHGSKTSTLDEFVGEVLPDIAVISLGKDNSYGHPHKETLDTLEKYDIYILRTDQYGDINLVSNGYNLKIK